MLSEAVDNAGGVEWDQDATGPGLAAGATRSYELLVRSAVPSALQLSPTNAASRQGVPINITATALDSNGQPYAGKTIRYSIAGPNAATGSATLDATGSAVMTDPGKKAGTDTVTAFVDFNGNGTRDTSEPQASAQATFVDSVPPNCTLKASGTLSRRRRIRETAGDQRELRRGRDGHSRHHPRSRPQPAAPRRARRRR